MTGFGGNVSRKTPNVPTTVCHFLLELFPVKKKGKAPDHVDSAGLVCAFGFGVVQFRRILVLLDSDSFLVISFLAVSRNICIADLGKAAS